MRHPLHPRDIGGFVGITAVLLSTSTVAQENFIAVGIGVEPEYLGSEDMVPTPFAAGRYDAGPIVIESRGLGLAFDFVSPLTGGTFAAGPVVGYRFGRDDVDNAVVDRLATVDPSFEIGGFARYSLLDIAMTGDSLSFEVSAMIDVSDGHGGGVVTPGVTYAVPVTDRFRTSIGVSANYGDGNFNDSFFSVDASGSAASGLPVFDADGGFYSAGLSLTGSYQLTQRWGVLGIVQVDRLIGDASSTPIVTQEGTETQVFGGLAISYSF
ncbi:MAG: MipA/OmpV family protein [Pseudomonadota bacterium]